MPKYKCFIDHDGDEKYIVVHVTPQLEMPYTAIVSKGGPYGAYHSDILDKFHDEVGSLTSVKMAGGGILTIDKANKTIKTYGKSGGYGAPQKELVETILRSCYPDWTLDVTVTNYIRG